jgi:uncharacterized protein (TIGR03089 family)
MTTFPSVLRARLGSSPAAPLVTFYDVRTGERTELSVTTYANWVAKTSSLLLEEYDVERGARVRLDLPAHWLSPVFLGAVWNLGAAAVLADGPADLVVTGPDGIDRARIAGAPVLATALHPLGRPFEAALPTGVDDFGRVVWSQPDAFTPYDSPEDEDVAVAGAPGVSSPAAAASSPRRTRLPLPVSPPSPSRSYSAARWSSWPATPIRSGSTRSARPSGSPTAVGSALYPARS